MRTLWCQRPLSVCLVITVSLVACAVCDSSFLLDPKRKSRDLQLSTSALKPLQVVDCVLEKCMWLSNPRDKRLCTYLLCLGGSKSVVAKLHGHDLGGENANRITGAFATSGYDSDDLIPLSDDANYAKQEATSQDMTRSKKWQYPDPLQHCVQTQCPGQKGVDFYTCVYNNCIAGKMTMNFMAV